MLEKYLEPIVVGGQTLDEKHQAYRMDSTSPQNDMRKKAGLGTCNCCDYFIAGRDNTVVFIEETQLVGQIKDLKSEYQYLQDDDQKDFVSKCIRDENKLKVYGSMLVLGHLATACREVKKLLKAKKYRFWLVVSGVNTAEEKIVFDNLKDRLSQELKSALTGNILAGVEIIPSRVFAAKLSRQASTP